VAALTAPVVMLAKASIHRAASAQAVAKGTPCSTVDVRLRQYDWGRGAGACITAGT
jgi:hypothetical protein